MDKKSDVFSANLLQDSGINSSVDMNFNSYRLDLSLRQLRIIQISLVYFDILNRSSMSQPYLDDLFYVLAQVDHLICQDLK